MTGLKPFLRSGDGAPSTLLTALLYFVCSLSLLLVDDRGGIAVFCCSDAVLLSALLLRKPADWRWPTLGCIAAILIANLVTGRRFDVSLAFAIGNMTTPLVAATIIRRVAGDDAGRTDTPLSILRLVALAGIAAPAIGAVVGGATLVWAFGRPFAPAAIEWFATESAGMLLGTPLLLMLWTGELWSWTAAVDRKRLTLAAGLMTAVAVGSFAAFHQGFAPLLFLPAILVIVTAFCIGRVGGAVSVLIVAVIGSEYAGRGGGQLVLVAGDPHLQILFLQSYLAIVLLTALPVAASLEESQRLQRALADSESRYRAMAEHSGDLITWVDAEGICRYASPAAQEMLGISPETLVGMEVGDLIHADDVGMVVDHHLRTAASPGHAETILYRASHADGRMLWMEAKTRAMLAADGRLLGVQWTIRDVTVHKSIEAMLAEAANSDPLTGLANRRAFFALLDIGITRVRETGQPLALAVIDLDHFKRVNDAWGHETGDNALRLAARAIQRTIRSEDLLARIGGEEFALLMPGAGLEDARAICERVRLTAAALDIPVPDNDPIRITLSAGLTLLAEDDDANSLVRAADRALYAGKHDGRDCIQIAARDTKAARREG